MNLTKIKNIKIAELVGILLGDGYISLNLGNKSSSRLKISFNSKDDSQYIYYVKIC